MPKTRKPRSGSLQYWPRVRANRPYARIRQWSSKVLTAGKPAGFAGFKAGMTHVMLTDNRTNSKTKGMDICVPVTIIECPPIKVMGVRFYKKDAYGKSAAMDVLAKLDKDVLRKVPKNNKTHTLPETTDGVVELRLLVHTKPSQTGIGQKKPAIFELAMGGSIDEQLAYAKEKLGKDITIQDVFAEGDMLDIHSVTKGKGFQGPVKRFGVTLRNHKSEKVIRGPGNLGAWSPGHGNFYVAHAGQMGYHARTERNKHLLKITPASESSSLAPQGGFLRYGIPKCDCILVKGSLPGTTKRLIILTTAERAKQHQAPSITLISRHSPQGR
ncbi:50S ribosomal protein L3 [Candidatus Woesearchaeota archaeon CG1_02_57_44]|nr:MAG: 50S ribosomal protein L3 [Candidatus Woesearchaeota archaeon CG1_02_57_44]